MRAIILAAGKGSRLNGAAGDLPKCLVRIGDSTLIEHQIQALRSSGIDDIIVVTGYGDDHVRDTCARGVSYIKNTRYYQTNSLFSLWLTRRYLLGGFIVMNGDVLFHPQLLKDLLASKHEDALLISYCDEASPLLGDEEMKVKVRGGTVMNITKMMNPQDADGENVGIVKFGPDGARVLIEKMNTLIASGAHRDWAPRAFREFALERPLYVISTRGYPWIEIDYPEDYRRAVSEVLPLIVMDAELGEEPLMAAAIGGEL